MKTFVFIIFTSLFFFPERSLFFTDSSLYRFHESTWKSSQSPAIISRKQLSDSCNGFRSHEYRVAQLVTEVCGWSTCNSECCWSVRCGGREIIHLLILWSTCVTTARWSAVVWMCILINFRAEFQSLTEIFNEGASKMNNGGHPPPYPPTFYFNLEIYIFVAINFPSNIRAFTASHLPIVYDPIVRAGGFWLPLRVHLCQSESLNRKKLIFRSRRRGVETRKYL